LICSLIIHTDFGLSKHFKFGEMQHEAVGTPYTVAPEVIRGKYDERCDIWAIGVIAYLLLSGDPPFGGCGGPEPLLTVRSNILRGAFKFEPEEVWSIVSPQAKEFIATLLVIDPKRRPTARDAQKHRWLREWASKDMKDDDHRLNPNVVKALVSFKEFSDMRKLLCEVLSFTLLPDQIKDLRKEFEKMDTDGSGEISLKALKHVLMTNAGAGSLGALTETEVEDIFNAMRVRKTEQRIHWHEFIAAGLSQCQVDDRNLRLAFDRLDSDHKGYITFENMMDLMGNDPVQSEDAMRSMWLDSMKACKCHHARITFDDFILLMKGQTRETEFSSDLAVMPKLEVVHEDGEVVETQSKGEPDSDAELSVGLEGIITSDNIGAAENCSRDVLSRNSWSSQRNSLGLLPTASSYSHQNIMSEDIDLDGPLSMDDDDDNDRVTGLLGFGHNSKLLSQCAIDIGVPNAADSDEDNISADLPNAENINSAFRDIAPLPLFPKRPAPYIRRRSRSVDDQDPDVEAHEVPSFGADARRAMMLPEHEHNDKEIESIVQSGSKTALVVNRKLYRAHRQMRLAVLEATKRFEEQQARRAHEILSAQRDSGGHEEIGPVGAGLVLRRGLQKQVSSEAVGTWLKKTKEEQAALVEKANKRGGRGKSRRQKTNSDMSGMLLCLSSDLSNINLNASLKSPDEENEKFGTSDTLMNYTVEESDAFIPLRNATVPGEFRATKDPFGEGGRYSSG
jgi:Ca2+-binding EF-hand superfamily protein